MMVKRTPFIVILLVSFIIFNAPTFLLAWDKGGDETKLQDYLARKLRRGFQLADKNLYDGGFILKHKEKLNLTAQQERNIETIIMDFKESAILKSAEVKIRELRFARYIGSDQIDKKEMARHIREIGNQKTDWLVAYINYLLDLRLELKQSQLETLQRINEEKKKMKGQSKQIKRSRQKK
jgi:hypothetical protein